MSIWMFTYTFIVLKVWTDKLGTWLINDNVHQTLLFVYLHIQYTVHNLLIYFHIRSGAGQVLRIQQAACRILLYSVRSKICILKSTSGTQHLYKKKQDFASTYTRKATVYKITIFLIQSWKKFHYYACIWPKFMTYSITTHLLLEHILVTISL